MSTRDSKAIEGSSGSSPSHSNSRAPASSSADHDHLSPRQDPHSPQKDGTNSTAAEPYAEATAEDVIVYNSSDAYPDELEPSSEWDALRNKNVSRTLVFCFLDGAAFSIWRQDVFQVLVKQLGGDTAVGWMSAASGVTQMVAALGAGYIGSRLKHETVLRCGSIAGLLGVALSMFAASHLSVRLFYLSQAVCGIYSGITATTTEAVFADSVATGRRAFVYNLKWMDQTLCSCVGLITCCCVLFSLGNEWKQPALVKTMFVGMVLHPAAMLMLWTLRDKYALKEEEDATDIVVLDVAPPQLRASASDVELMRHLDDDHDHDKIPADPQERVSGAYCTANEDTPWSSGLGRPSAMRRSDMVVASSERRVHWSTTPPTVVITPSVATPVPAPDVSPASSAASPSGRPPRSAGQKAVQRELEEACEATKRELHANLAAASSQYGTQLRLILTYAVHVAFTWEAVPYLVCLVDFLVAFGSGMTMRYLSLFFVEDYKTTPLTLLTASLLISPLQAVLSSLVQRSGDLYIGRLPSTIVVRLIGTTLLLIMGTVTLPLEMMLPIFIFRNALMNATRGVTRSVIMDCVRKENRAKWSAFESFSSFTWAGSAVIGGYIAEVRGYRGTFVITAFFHYCSLAVLIPGAMAAMPVERQLMQGNRAKHHTSCKMVTVGVLVVMTLSSGLYVWLRSEITKRGW